MRALTVVPQRVRQRRVDSEDEAVARLRAGRSGPGGGPVGGVVGMRRYPRPHSQPRLYGRARPQGRGAMAPLMDAKAAGQLLGVPYTWLLAQARSGRVPHHKLGHYVRFDQADLERWLDENRGGPELSPMVGGPSVSHQAVRSVSSMRGRPAAAGPIGRR